MIVSVFTHAVLWPDIDAIIKDAIAKGDGPEGVAKAVMVAIQTYAGNARGVAFLISNQLSFSGAINAIL